MSINSTVALNLHQGIFVVVVVGVRQWKASLMLFCWSLRLTRGGIPDFICQGHLMKSENFPGESSCPWNDWRRCRKAMPEPWGSSHWTVVRPLSQQWNYGMFSQRRAELTWDLIKADRTCHENRSSSLDDVVVCVPPFCVCVEKQNMLLWTFIGSQKQKNS